MTLEAPLCKVCKKREWRHVCKGQPKLPALHKPATRPKPKVKLEKS